MTRVAGIPEQLQSLAATLVGSGPELELAAGVLNSAAGSLPSMPGGVASQVESALAQAQRLIRASAQAAANEGRDLRRRGLWLEIADRIKEAWEPASVGFGMVATPNDIFSATSKWRVARLMQTWGAYQAAVSPAVAAEGEPSLAALDAQLAFEERTGIPPDRFATLLEGAGDDAKYLEALGSAARIGEVVGRYTPYAGIVGGVVEFVHPMHKHGALMLADRTAGAGTALGSAGLILAASSLIEVPGVGEVALVVVIAAGLWELYENREEVARLTVAGGKFALNHAYLAAGPAGILAKEGWDDRRQLIHGLVSTADTGKNLAEDGAKTIVGGAEDAGKSVVSETKHLFGHIGSVHVGGVHFP
jgi:hypothetical protein